MPIIRASCQSCGDVELVPKDLKIAVCSDTGESSYTFRCPGCRSIVSKEAEKRIVEVLVSAGVKMRFWKLPAELTESHSGPPLEVNDLIDFHFEISQGKALDVIHAFYDNYYRD